MIGTAVSRGIHKQMRRFTIVVVLVALVLTGAAPLALAAEPTPPPRPDQPLLLAPVADAVITEPTEILVGLQDGSQDPPARVELRVTRTSGEDEDAQTESLHTFAVEEFTETNDGRRWTTTLPGGVLPNGVVRIEVRAADLETPEDGSDPVAPEPEDESDWSGHGVTLDLAPPATTLTAEPVVASPPVELAWQAVGIPDLISYTVQRASGPDEFEDLATLERDVSGNFLTAMRDAEVATGHHRYRVVTTRQTGSSLTSTSEEIQVTVLALEPNPTEPDPTEPDPTEPEPTEPEPAPSEPLDPEPSEPEPSSPEPTEPEPSPSEEAPAQEPSAGNAPPAPEKAAQQPAQPSNPRPGVRPSGTTRVAGTPPQALGSIPAPADTTPRQSLLSFNDLAASTPLQTPFAAGPERPLAARSAAPQPAPRPQPLAQLPTADIAVLPVAPGRPASSLVLANAEDSAEPLRLSALVFCAFVLGWRGLRPHRHS